MLGDTSEEQNTTLNLQKLCTTTKPVLYFTELRLDSFFLTQTLIYSGYPTSSVGGHVRHLLKGIQEGHSSQNSGSRYTENNENLKLKDVVSFN